MPRDAVSRTANDERNGGHKWVTLRLREDNPCLHGSLEIKVSILHWVIFKDFLAQHTFFITNCEISLFDWTTMISVN